MAHKSSKEPRSDRLVGVSRALRKPRADGEESRRAILHAAAQLATTRGLESLSIGELARHIGMSKSGLYAHFKSKEELELATIETAAEIFDQEVLSSARESPGGLVRVMAVSEAFLQHLERRVFPGGCFFANVSMQLAASPGRPRDRVMEILARWLELFARALSEAVDAGELPRDADLNQMAFELNAMLVRANFSWVLTGEQGVLDQARAGVRHVIERFTEGQDRETGKSERPSTRGGRRARG